MSTLNFYGPSKKGTVSKSYVTDQGQNSKIAPDPLQPPRCGRPTIHLLPFRFPHLRHRSFDASVLMPQFGYLLSSQSRSIQPSRSHLAHRPPMSAQDDKDSKLLKFTSNRSTTSFGRSTNGGYGTRVRSIPPPDRHRNPQPTPAQSIKGISPANRHPPISSRATKPYRDRHAARHLHQPE